MKCTLCDKEIETIYIQINFNFLVKRKLEDDTYEMIPNSIQDSKEILCQDCFNKFVDSLSNTMLEE